MPAVQPTKKVRVVAEEYLDIQEIQRR